MLVFVYGIDDAREGRKPGEQLVGGRPRYQRAVTLAAICRVILNAESAGVALHVLTSMTTLSR